MCLILFSFHNHPKYKLALIANRDEFYDRPTESAGWWHDHDQIIGGRDLSHQGTWLALNKQGKFAAITNYRDPKNVKKNAPSRGNLIKDFLTSTVSSEDYLKVLEDSGNEYNGFNLLFGHQDKLLYYSNYAESSQVLVPGNYGLSNSLLDTPWPKVVKGKAKLDALLHDKKALSVASAIEALKDNKFATDYELPDTGIGLEKERILSPMFIKSPGYGSRCSTIITIDYDNVVDFYEISYQPENEFHTTFEIHH